MKKLMLICTWLISVSLMLSNKTLAQEEVTKPAVLIINAVVDQEHKQELQGYLSKMMQIFKEHGGKPLGRYKTVEKIQGSQAPDMIAMISFEKAETIKALLDDEAYKDLAELRERIFSDLKLVICSELN